MERTLSSGSPVRSDIAETNGLILIEADLICHFSNNHWIADLGFTSAFFTGTVIGKLLVGFCFMSCDWSPDSDELDYLPYRGLHRLIEYTYTTPKKTSCLTPVKIPVAYLGNHFCDLVIITPSTNPPSISV